MSPRSSCCPSTTSAPSPPCSAAAWCNYWGYNTLGFFAPHAEYARARISTGSEVLDEFRDMVKALHHAGIEVLLDVVYNHTGEGPVNGPVLSLRGLDNRGYYRHVWENTGQYADYTGCGNTVDTRSPQALTLVMDSLRFWVQDMHVDGFRFDLASALSRDRYNFDDHSAFLERDRARTRCSSGSSSSPSRGTSARVATRSAGSRSCGASGTAATATRCATSGPTAPAASATWPTGWPDRRTCTATTAASRGRRSTSSPHTTVSPCAT